MKPTIAVHFADVSPLFPIAITRRARRGRRRPRVSFPLTCRRASKKPGKEMVCASRRDLI